SRGMSGIDNNSRNRDDATILPMRFRTWIAREMVRIRSGPGELEQQIGRDDVFVVRPRRQARVLEHPVRWKHQEPPRARFDAQTEIGKLGLAAFRDVVEIPEEHKITIARVVDRVEMRLELIGGSGEIAFDAQLLDALAARNRQRQAGALVVDVEI